MKPVISKEDFVKALQEVKSVHRYQAGLNDYFRNSGCDGGLLQPDCIDTVLNLLHTIFGKADENEWISYFVFELDFGESYEPGIIKDCEGKDIGLSDECKLYDFLIELMNEQGF